MLKIITKFTHINFNNFINGVPMNKYKILVLVLLIGPFLTAVNFSQNLERKDVPVKYTWNLNDLYSNENTWSVEKGKITQELDKVAEYKGKLGESAKTLTSALDLYFDMIKQLYRYSEYAYRLSDEDLSNSHYQSLKQEASHLGTEISEKTAFLNPEILRIDPSKIKTFFQEDKDLAQYKMFIDDIQRLRKHTLSESEEKILASFGAVTETPENVYSIFTNAEFPFAEVNLSDGEEVKLTPSAYTKYRSIPNRSDRAKVFKALFEKYGEYRNTIGANLGGKMKSDWTYAKDRNYSSSVESALDANNIPVSVYNNLIKQIHNSLPTLHRFLKLKKEMLGVDTLHYYDLYTPIVKKVEMKFDIPEGQKTILAALKPLGQSYLNTVQKAFNDRWIDYMPTVGKKSGAYSSGESYDVHPYILTNWNGDYESVSTLAHELGHTMHSYLSNTNQTFVNSQYPIFVAEIASTLNETLLNDYMVKNAKSDKEKLYLLGSYLELLRTTIFRQTQFAEFELAMHQMAETGKPITGETLSKLYDKIVKEYYGNNEGYCIVDPYIAYEWEYIPHFMYDYYVYQYSTSLIYATALAEKIIKDGKPAVDKYFNILKGGSSDYPIELIKKAGIDPLSAEPFKLTMDKMNRVMDQIEQILSKEKEG